MQSPRIKRPGENVCIWEVLLTHPRTWTASHAETAQANEEGPRRAPECYGVFWQGGRLTQQKKTHIPST